MLKCDSIVAGGGISGMTMALFLALNGHSVVLLEKAPRLGGSMGRFRRGGIPFDTGFHFTGGLNEGGILLSMLRALGIEGMIEPIFLPRQSAMRFVFKEEAVDYTIPYGVADATEAIKGYFPDEAGAVDEYFRLMRHVCENTPSMDLGSVAMFHPSLREDTITLDEVLSGLTSNAVLKGLLSGFAMCYGVRPSEVSFSSHSRMSMNLYESIAYVKGGGDAFISAFKRRFGELGVTVRLGDSIAAMVDISNSRVRRFILQSGEEVEAGRCVFTIHPREVLKVLPAGHFKKAFVNRVEGLEPSIGFFSVYAALNEGGGYSGQLGSTLGSTIVSLFPHADVDRMMDPSYEGWPGVVAIKSIEGPMDSGLSPLHLLEPAFPGATARWEDSKAGRRPAGYLRFKEEKAANILAHMFEAFPSLRDRVKVLDSASMLTCRDYLNSPEGSAYGVKQKIGQFNVVGKLSLRNLYVAGQSAVLPGVIGAMMSSFLVGGSVVGQERYSNFLKAINGRA